LLLTRPEPRFDLIRADASADHAAQAVAQAGRGARFSRHFARKPLISWNRAKEKFGENLVAAKSARAPLPLRDDSRE
jgi:hypothetical protein